MGSKCRLWAAVLDQSSLNSFSPGSEVVTVLCLLHQLLSEVVLHTNSVNLRAVHVTAFMLTAQLHRLSLIHM